MSDENFVEVRLPEPDSHADSTNERGDETNAAQWELTFLHWADGIVTAYDTGIEIEGVHYDTDDDLIWKLEDDARRLLAAIEEHRRCHDAYLKRQAEAKKENRGRSPDPLGCLRQGYPPRRGAEANLRGVDTLRWNGYC